MAVKCNIPNLALESIYSAIYGFSCKDVTKKIIQNYIEYLNCSGVDYAFCDNFPCTIPSGDVFCFIDAVNLSVINIGSTTATVTFVVPTQPYTVTVINEELGTTVYTATNPTSPINLTGLVNDTDYLVRLTLLCTGGEVKQVETPFHTLPICVTITDFVGEATLTP